MFRVLYFLITSAATLALAELVPVEHQRNYAQCPKDRFAWAVFFVGMSLPASAIGQAMLAPSAPFPDWLRWTGAALFAGGNALIIWARRVNPFYTPKVQMPGYIVEHGPYALRHPGYLGMALGAAGTFFLLSEDVVIVPTGIYLGMLAARTITESIYLSRLKSHNS